MVRHVCGLFHVEHQAWLGMIVVRHDCGLFHVEHFVFLYWFNGLS